MKTFESAFIVLLLVSCGNKPAEQTLSAPSAHNLVVDTAQLLSENADSVNTVINLFEDDDEVAARKSLQLNDRLFELMAIPDTTSVLNARLQSISAEDFNPSLAAPPYPYIVYDTLEHRKVKDRLGLPFDDGSYLVLKDLDDNLYNDAMAIYEYSGYFDNIQKYIVEISFWEGYTCMLVDKRDGTISAFPSVPVFSKDGSRMYVQDDNPYDDETLYLFYEKQGEKFRLTHKYHTPYLPAVSAYWKGNNKVYIKYCTIEYKDPPEYCIISIK